MKVAICDDDLNFCGVMEWYLLKIFKKYINLRVDLDVYQSGEEMLRILEAEKVRPQILFLDMEMMQMNGIETARKLRNKDHSMLIIYVTSYDKYTMDSFEVSPFRYLLKPVNYEKIEQIFSAAVDEILNNHACLFFKRNYEQIQINCEEIISVVSENGRMLRVNTLEEHAQNLFYAKIKDVEKQLNPFVFVKVNQGTHMSVIEFSLFYFLVILITVLQSTTAYIYFSEYFVFRLGKKFFFAITFFYMLVIKVLPERIFVRLVLLLVFLSALTTVALFGSIEKKIYHVLSFTFSLTLCEITFSTLNGAGGMNIHTEYLKWIAVYFLVNILFFLFIIAIIKFLMYFREKNDGGLTGKEYVLLSLIPLASLIIIYVMANMPFQPKIISCVCLIFINLSSIMIYDSIAKKNHEIHRFMVIEEQNRYYQERLTNQHELIRMRHDLKNILITMDSFILKNDVRAVKEQLDALLKTRTLRYNEFTGCVAIDSILNVKIQKIKENSINYNLNLRIPSDLKIKDSNVLDVSAILGNLLDNAIEAVLRLEKNKEKKIDIAIQYNNGKLIFNFQNTSNQLLTDFSHELIKSEKGKERFGIGISSIKERVDRLKGYYDFCIKGGQYTALIVLPIENS